eukprot:593769-Ditylum_brightwellii.AAC.1
MGSGKTYTMQRNGLTGSIPKDGVETNAVDGIIQMVARDLLGNIEPDPAREFLLCASFVERFYKLSQGMEENEEVLCQ